MKILKLLLITVIMKIVFQSTLDLRINKKISLIKHITEESYIIEGTNNMSRSIKEFKFRINPKLYDNLRIILYSENVGNNFLTSKIELNSFKITLKKPIETDGVFAIRINLYFFNNFTFKPYKIKMREDQMVEHTDNLVNLEFENFIRIDFFNAMYILFSKAIKFPAHQIEDIKELENGYHKYNFKTFYAGENNHFVNNEIIFYFQMNSSFDIFTNYKRELEISLWGNIKETNNIDVTNKGAELDGEFSNIDFIPTDPKTGKNSLRWMQTLLPGELSGLSITDEIGNVTKPIAIKKNNQVFLNIIPRFPLFGKWNSTWNISYNQKTTKYLFKDSKNSDVYKFQYPFAFSFETVLAENYQLSFCLPEFSEVLKIEIPFEFDEMEEYKIFGYFEYFGKKCFRYKFKNILPQLFEGNFEIYFKYNSSFLWLKFFILTLFISSIFFMAFLMKRLDFGLDDKIEEVSILKKQKKD